MILNLPFAYEAEILPSRRHKNPRTKSLRGYTPVMIPELASDNLDEAIVIQPVDPTHGAPEASTTILTYGGLLFQPAIAEGRQLRDRELKEAVSADIKFEVWTKYLPADAGQLPYAGTRTNNAMSPAMYCDTFDRQMDIDGFPFPYIERSDENSRRAETQDHYSRAILLVDGAIHVEVPEPVWRVRTIGETTLVQRELEPKLLDAAQLFTLNQLAHAERFARLLEGAGDHGQRRLAMMIRDASVLARVDAHELAKLALFYQSTLYILFCRLRDEPDFDWRNETLNARFLGAEKDPRGEVARSVVRLRRAEPGRSSGADRRRRRLAGSERLLRRWGTR